jgi:hypothetical protein
MFEFLSTIFPFLFMGAVFYQIASFNKKRKLKSAKHAMAIGVGGAATMNLLQQIQQQQMLDEDLIEQMESMNLEQLQQFALDQHIIDQNHLQEMMNHAMDPFRNPGLDIVVDESFHGIQHDHNHDVHNNHDMHNNH